MDQEKLAAVAHLTAAGQSTRQIAQQLDVSHGTVNNWQHLDEVRQRTEELRPRIAAMLSERVFKAVSDEAANIPLRDLMIAWGISMDKYDRSTATGSPQNAVQINITVGGQPVTISPIE